MSARQKHKHKPRHHTHAKKPASLPRTSLAKAAAVIVEPELTVEANPEPAAVAIRTPRKRTKVEAV